MKNLLKLSLALFLVAFYGCEETEAPVFNQEFVAFDGSITTVSEADAAFEITITGSAPGLSKQLSFAGTAVLNQDYNVDTETVTIGDDYVTTLTVTPVDNLLIDGTREAVITLNDGGFPGGARGQEYTVRFLDNDCVRETSSTYAGTGSAFGANIPTWSVELTAVDGTDNQFVVNSAWGPEFVAWATGDPSFSGSFLYSGVITIESDNSLSFVGDDSRMTDIEGNYAPCDDTFTITLSQTLFSSDFTVDVVWTGNGD